MSNFENIDIENITAQVTWSTEKAKCILNDVHDYFICESPSHPDTETLNSIRYNFKSIFVKLSIISDILDGVEAAIKPLDDAVTRKAVIR